MKILLTITLILGQIFLPGISAADGILSWNDCVSEVAKNNPDLHVAQANVDVARMQTRVARSAYLPQASANLTYSYGSSSSAVTGTGSGSSSFVSTGTGNNTTKSATVSVTENLFSGWQDHSKVQQGVAGENTALAALTVARAKASYDLKNGFANLLFAQRAVKLSQDIIRRRQDNLNLIQLRFENGRENKGSLLLSKAYLEQAKYNELQARDNIEVSQEQLAKVLGRNDPRSIRITGDVPTRNPPNIQTVHDLVPTTPLYYQALAQTKQAAAAVSVARSQFLPSLNANATAGVQNSSRWLVGMSMNWPFFTGGKDHYTTQGAIAGLASASANQESVTMQISTTLETNLTHFIEAVQKLKVDQSFLDAQTVREEIARQRYENGLLSFEDWDIIENDYIARQQQVLQSQHDRVTAEAAWEQTQGQGVFNDSH